MLDTRFLGLVTALTVLAACGENPLATDAPLFNAAVVGDAVTHHVSVGGADFCEGAGLPTGCDANFSLVANEKADGSAQGQWQDTFRFGMEGGGNGVHVAVDCLNVVGNGAIIGGAVTHGSVGDFDVTGFRVLTAVMDNGTSANDPPDQIIGTVGVGPGPGDPSLCHIVPSPDALADDVGGWVDLTHGQVTIR